MKKIILVTGASSGLGLATAGALAGRGHIVYGTSRSIQRLDKAVFRKLEMDVTSDVSVQEGIQKILVAEGRIDVVINNAGNGIAGPLYAMPAEVAKRQFEVNFFGVVRVNSAVLPGMIERKEGLVINIGSLAGLFGLPYQGVYSASKFAIEGYSESLRMELHRAGIRVSVINPGDFKTDFTASREKLDFGSPNLRLKKEFEAAVAAIEKDENNGAHPDKLAVKICRIVEQDNPSQRYLVGGLGQTIVPFLKKVLPGSIFIRLLNAHYGIK